MLVHIKYESKINFYQMQSTSYITTYHSIYTATIYINWMHQDKFVFKCNQDSDFTLETKWQDFKSLIQTEQFEIFCNLIITLR